MVHEAGRRRRARAPTASPCCATPTATAWPRPGPCSCKDLNSPFGMALVGNDLYVANTDALLRFPYKAGETQITASRRKVTDLPAGTINHHWTKNVIASPDGTQALRDGRLQQQRRRERHGRRSRPRRDLGSRPATGSHRIFAYGPAQSQRHGLGAAERRAVDRGQRARRARQRPGARLHDLGQGRRASTAGRTATTASTSTPASSRSGPTWSPRPSRPTTRWARTRPRWAWRFADGASCARAYANGAFIGQHGSWNRKPLSGYAWSSCPSRTASRGGARRPDRLRQPGRQGPGPPGRRGDRQARRLLVADDVGNVIWRLSK